MLLAQLLIQEKARERLRSGVGRVFYLSRDGIASQAIRDLRAKPLGEYLPEKHAIKIYNLIFYKNFI